MSPTTAGWASCFPQIVWAHLCIGDPVASAVQTAEKKTRSTKALTPSWVVLVEGGGEREALKDACSQLLTTEMLVGSGAIDLASGLYQLQFQPG